MFGMALLWVSRCFVTRNNRLVFPIVGEVREMSTHLFLGMSGVADSAS